MLKAKNVECQLAQKKLDKLLARNIPMSLEKQNRVQQRLPRFLSLISIVQKSFLQSSFAQPDVIYPG